LTLIEQNPPIRGGRLGSATGKLKSRDLFFPKTMEREGGWISTTFYGGKLACYDGISNGCGVIFEITKTGEERVLYRFGGKADGGYPIGGVVQDAQGNLYGTTSLGGDLTCGNGAGCGVIFKKPKIGKEVVLHVFSGSDGEFPSAALFLDSKGNLYGTTPSGGAHNGGVVFELTP
jgi:uncharacterized repeat protein (TIGR03803 family)